MSAFDFLKGNRTYLQAIAGMVVFGAMQMGWIDVTTANTVLGFLGLGMVMSLRAGMK